MWGSKKKLSNSWISPEDNVNAGDGEERCWRDRLNSVGIRYQKVLYLPKTAYVVLEWEADETWRLQKHLNIYSPTHQHLDDSNNSARDNTRFTKTRCVWEWIQKVTKVAGTYFCFMPNVISLWDTLLGTTCGTKLEPFSVFNLCELVFSRIKTSWKQDSV